MEIVTWKGWLCIGFLDLLPKKNSEEQVSRNCYSPLPQVPQVFFTGTLKILDVNAVGIEIRAVTCKQNLRNDFMYYSS